jgi:V/A-type H+-transporting ATPase subunit K
VNFDKQLLNSGAIIASSTLFAALMLMSTMSLVRPSVLSSLGLPTSPILEPLQSAAGGWAIFGIALGAGLAVGLAGVGAALGMGTASAAALGAITEKPETFGKSILYVVFIEAVAIYGLVISFLLLGYIPTLIAG